MSTRLTGYSAAWLDHARRDAAHAWRMIRRMPGLATVVIVSLAIGIGVNAAIFSWIQALVFKPLPGVRDAAAFHFLEPRTESGSLPGVSWLEYHDLREQTTSFRDLLAYRMAPLTLGESGRTVRTYGLLVSGNYFSALGLEPALGRFFTPNEAARPGGDPVVVVSDGFWRTRLADVANPVGHTLRVNDRELTVVGVAP
ncbi:MAG: permease, partial [Geminicoccaceae bacterium]|nr:permease [Geminicoccaceae bacterium]